ncbi:MAG: histidinol dehydrogenase [Chloroflexi bacterium]|nr:histidinol dehydrogenase [Chloroflexota bacterium]
MTIRVINSLDEAKDSVLRRRPIAERPLPPRVVQGIREAFGRDLSAEQVVELIISEVQANGDRALLDLSRRIDRAELSSIEVPRERIEEAYSLVPRELVDALKVAADRIADFHVKHVPKTWIDFSEDGALGQLIRPLGRVGLYSPGGTADYPSTILMQAIPARVAGVQEVVVASPPRGNGAPSPLTLVASDIANVDHVFAVGGAQAIAAMAFGTESIPRVDKILGPGNIFVTLAKRRVFGTVGIDQLAGPTETLVIADDSASPAAVALDLLAQAEHDPLASAILLTTSSRLAALVQQEIDDRLQRLERASIAAESLKANGAIVMVESVDQAVNAANSYAPEHLCLIVENGWSYLGKIRNAGGVFLGECSPEVVGDYTAGPSHVMPTGGTARFSSPISVLDFVKVTSLVALGAETVRRIGPATVTIAQAEGLTAHAEAMKCRLPKTSDDGCAE